MKRIGYIAIGLIAGLVLAGGAAFAVTAGGPWDNSVQDAALARQNDQTKRLIQTQPAPELKYSVERQNLIQRYKTYSDKNKISYIALTTLTGSVMYTGVVKGKISAVSSQLSPADRAQCVDNGDHQIGCVTVQVPEPDGSWSTNGAGIFWFDDRGVYHEWNGTYMVADQPFTLSSAPLLTINAEAR